MLNRWTIILAACLVTAPVATAQTWSQENADPANLNRLDRSTPDSLSDAGTAPLGADVITQVIEGPAGLAIAGTLDGQVVAIDASGEIVWRADVPGPMRTAPAWTGQHIIAVPRADSAVALEPDGSTAWTLPIENVRSSASLVRMASPALHPSGDVIIATLAGNVHRVSDDGDTVWTHDVGGDNAVEATPAVTPNGHVLVAGFVPGQEGAGRLSLLDADTGEVIWSKGIGSQVVGAPAIVGELFLLPLRDGDAVQGRSLEDASVQWSVTYDDHVTHSPSVHGQLALAGDIRGVLRAIDVSDGTVAWTFNPNSDDPDLSQVASGGVLTVADSPAIDAQGRAWVPYWNADMSTCCPPTDSRPSPFYLIDAKTGEQLDKARYDKAAHGPALHETGVWVGSDEGLVRHWSTGTTLQVDAFTDAANVTLVTNTDRADGWRIDWGTEGVEQGDGRPPPLATETLSEGEHTITVTVGEASASTTVTIDETSAAQGGADGGTAGDGASDDASGGADGDGTGTTGDGSDTRPDGTDDADQAPGGDETQGTPLGPLTALLAGLLAAAWGRRRA